MSIQKKGPFYKALIAKLLWGGILLITAGLIFLASGKDHLRWLNLLIPVATLVLVWIVWRRQQSHSKYMRRKYDEASQVFERLYDLSKSLERAQEPHRLSRPADGVREADVDPDSPEDIRPTLH